jgi:hypothetical protein
MDAKQASEQLGVSRAMVYKLAAPHGPIRCTHLKPADVVSRLEVAQT